LFTKYIPQGGDVNITDSDGDTPLYTVENVETARFLVEQGAVVDRRNGEGISVRVIFTSTYIIDEMLFGSL
jgi:hypothetical protein